MPVAAVDIGKFVISYTASVMKYGQPLHEELRELGKSQSSSSDKNMVCRRENKSSLTELMIDRTKSA